MTRAAAIRAEHELTVRSAARTVFRLIADIENWPMMFRPFVHLEPLGLEPLGLEPLGHDNGFERIGMWTTAGKTVDHWVMLRKVDEEALSVAMRPETPHPPITSMDRMWVVQPLAEQECRIRLVTDYEVADGDQATLTAVGKSIDDVATRELDAVRAAAELPPDLLLVLDDVVHVTRSEQEVYEFLYNAGEWPQRLAHVVKADVLQDTEHGQLLEVETNETRGGVLLTRTARVGFPHRKIAYKQLLLPPLGSSHHVRWTITRTPSGASVGSRQVVVLNDPEVREFVTRELHSKVRLVLDGIDRIDR